MNFKQAGKLPKGTMVILTGHDGEVLCSDLWYKYEKFYYVGYCESGDGDYGVIGEEGHVAPEDFCDWEFEVVK